MLVKVLNNLTCFHLALLV